MATRNHTRIVRNLLLSTLLMFGFGFALVPLYDVFCEVTGLNGKITNTGPVKTAMSEDSSRTVRVQMIAINNEAMPWDFAPQEALLTVHPGETRQTAYLARNPTNHYMVAQAIPSVSPSEAAQYLHKVNCFCFDRQPLQAQEQREMPLLFVIDPELPKHINTITLSYTLFDITATEQASVTRGGNRL